MGDLPCLGHRGEMGRLWEVSRSPLAATVWCQGRLETLAVGDSSSCTKGCVAGSMWHSWRVTHLQKYLSEEVTGHRPRDCILVRDEPLGLSPGVLWDYPPVQHRRSDQMIEWFLLPLPSMNQ